MNQENHHPPEEAYKPTTVELQFAGRALQLPVYTPAEEKLAFDIHAYCTEENEAEKRKDLLSICTVARYLASKPDGQPANAAAVTKATRNLFIVVLAYIDQESWSPVEMDFKDPLAISFFEFFKILLEHPIEKPEEMFPFLLRLLLSLHELYPVCSPAHVLATQVMHVLMSEFNNYHLVERSEPSFFQQLRETFSMDALNESMIQKAVNEGQLNFYWWKLVKASRQCAKELLAEEEEEKETET